jgi:polyribonucleotide nucleotidyltransferase
VSGLTREFKAGDIVEGTVSKILDFGAVVDLSPFADGLLHISELANYRVNKVEDIVKLGDKVKVKIIATDPASGKISLSIKALPTQGKTIL